MRGAGTAEVRIAREPLVPAALASAVGRKVSKERSAAPKQKAPPPIAWSEALSGNAVLKEAARAACT